jgi:hypothetical protein
VVEVVKLGDVVTFENFINKETGIVLYVKSDLVNYLNNDGKIACTNISWITDVQPATRKTKKLAKSKIPAVGDWVSFQSSRTKLVEGKVTSIENKWLYLRDEKESNHLAPFHLITILKRRNMKEALMDKLNTLLEKLTFKKQREI